MNTPTVYIVCVCMYMYVYSRSWLADEAGIQCLALSPNQCQIVSASLKIKVWDLAEQKVKKVNHIIDFLKIKIVYMLFFFKFNS